MREVRDWASLLAAIGTLTLGALALRPRDPLARRIAALCFVLFGWNFSVLAQRIVRQQRAFEALDSVCTALSPLFVLEVVLAFVGRRAREVRIAAWVVFGGLGLSALVRPDDDVWAMIFLVAWAFTLVVDFVLLVRHLRAAAARERVRARIVIAALAFGGACSTSDMVHALGLPAPYLGALGTVVASALLFTLVTRTDLFERRVTLRTSLYVGGMIATGVIAYLVVLSAFAAKLGIQLLFACLLAAVGIAIGRELAISFADERARRQRLALLGRFSAQMSHDIKGPLTALLGAVQLIDPAENEYLGLVVEQAHRINDIVARYDRMARIDPQRTIVTLNEVATAIARAHGVETTLASDLPDIEADRALIESALENIVRNAVEAAGKSKVQVTTTRIETGARVTVTDQGPGMDARVLDRATEDFFTTKPTGSGLGLSFARRVIEAHGGTLTVESKPGKGTTVTATLLTT
jgi:signal transduction histidine kinase